MLKKQKTGVSVQQHLMGKQGSCQYVYGDKIREKLISLQENSRIRIKLYRWSIDIFNIKNKIIKDISPVTSQNKQLLLLLLSCKINHSA